MLPYYTFPFVSYPVQGMYSMPIQQQPVSPQFMQPVSMYQTPYYMPQGYPQMIPDMASGYMDDIYDAYDPDEDIPTVRPEDPPPRLSDNPATTSVTLFKELTAYPNYGNPSGNADILYTGNRGVWTFQLPTLFPFSDSNVRGQILIRGVLDDHYSVAENRYTATITVNGERVHTGRVRLDHGRPSGAKFDNWRTLTFDVSNLRRNNRIVITNTSNTGPNDWIALDWMELRLVPGR